MSLRVCGREKHGREAGINSEYSLGDWIFWFLVVWASRNTTYILPIHPILSVSFIHHRLKFCLHLTEDINSLDEQSATTSQISSQLACVNLRSPSPFPLKVKAIRYSASFVKESIGGTSISPSNKEALVFSEAGVRTISWSNWGEIVMWSTPARAMISSMDVRLAGRTLVLTLLALYKRCAWTHRSIDLLRSTNLVECEPLPWNG